jgi:flagellar biosynthesis/type III secretory pathway protein FliH
MTYVTSVERLGIAKGRAEGHAEGRVEGHAEGRTEGMYGDNLRPV